jgi:hypothetical protein
MGTLTSIHPATDNPLGILDRDASLALFHKNDETDDRHHQYQDNQYQKNPYFTG